MLMSKSCKSQIARREREKRGEMKGGGQRGGGGRGGEKQTEAGVNYGCNLRFPRGKKERQGETSSHAYQIAHLRHFPTMVREQTLTQSGLPLCVCVLEKELLHVHLCQVAWMCAALSAVLRTRYDVRVYSSVEFPALLC